MSIFLLNIQNYIYLFYEQKNIKSKKYQNYTIAAIFELDNHHKQQKLKKK